MKMKKAISQIDERVLGASPWTDSIRPYIAKHKMFVPVIELSIHE